MAITTAQIFRARIDDRHRRAIAVPVGDGLATSFQLPGNPIASGTAHSIAGSATLISPWGASTPIFDFTYGVVALSGATNIPSAGSAIGTAIFYHSIFADEEIDYLLNQNSNDLDLSHLSVIEWLMSDAYRRAMWRAGGQHGITYDDRQTMQNLQMQYSALRYKVYVLGQDDVGPIAWSETQAEYH